MRSPNEVDFWPGFSLRRTLLATLATLATGALLMGD